jgi:hypothetical protein
VRRQKLAMIRALLADIPGIGSQLYEDRAIPIEGKHLPAIALAPGPESSKSRNVSSAWPAVEHERSLTVLIAAVATTRAKADEIAVEIEQRMASAELPLQGTVFPVEGDAAHRVYVAELRYEIPYWTVANNPTLEE